MPITLTCGASVPDTGHPDVSKGVNFTWFEGDKQIADTGKLKKINIMHF